MFFRNTITTSALVVLLGLTGGSAFAMDYPEGDGALTDFDGYTESKVSVETATSFDGGDLPNQNG